MTRMLDCLVSYFGLDENERAGYRRYFVYHIVAGAGPTSEGGLASITTFALHDESERCAYCQNVHTVATGGPEAALAEAVHYLDAYHEHDHLHKVQSDIRGLQGELPMDRVASPRRASACLNVGPSQPGRAKPRM